MASSVTLLLSNGMSNHSRRFLPHFVPSSMPSKRTARRLSPGVMDVGPLRWLTPATVQQNAAGQLSAFLLSARAFETRKPKSEPLFCSRRASLASLARHDSQPYAVRL